MVGFIQGPVSRAYSAAMSLPWLPQLLVTAPVLWEERGGR